MCWPGAFGVRGLAEEAAVSALETVQALEHAVAALASCDPGDLEALLPRLAQADLQLLNIRHSTRDLCSAERARREDERVRKLIEEPA